MARDYSDGAYETLRFMVKWEIEGKGQPWRGVRGWLFASEFPHTLPLAAAFAQSLARNLYIAADDVRDPFVTRPLNLYRVTQLGGELLAARDAQADISPTAMAPPEITAPNPERSDEERDTVFMAHSQWRGLEALKRQPRDTWLSLAEVQKSAQFRFFVEDAEFLAKHLLVERDSAGSATRYRATVLGRGARSTAFSDRYAQVHIRGVLSASERALNVVERQMRRLDGGRGRGPMSGG